MNISRGIFFWFLCLANEHWPIKALKRSREEPVLHPHITTTQQRTNFRLHFWHFVTSTSHWFPFLKLHLRTRPFKFSTIFYSKWPVSCPWERKHQTKTWQMHLDRLSTRDTWGGGEAYHFFNLKYCISVFVYMFQWTAHISHFHSTKWRNKKCFCTVLKLAPYAHVKCMSCCVKTVLVGLMYDNVWSQHSSPHPGSFGSSFWSGWCLGIGRQTEPSCSSWSYLTRLRPFFYPSVSGRFKRCWNRARPRLACRGNRNKKV